MGKTINERPQMSFGINLRRQVGPGETLHYPKTRPQTKGGVFLIACFDDKVNNPLGQNKSRDPKSEDNYHTIYLSELISVTRFL